MSENKGYPNQWAARYAEINAIAQNRIDAERLAREQKTAKLKALRLAQDEPQPTPKVASKPHSLRNPIRRATIQQRRR